MDKFNPFDPKRMWLGDESPWLLAEIVVRTGFLYAFMLLMMRLLGKRALGHLSPFELIVVIALGSSVGDPMMHPDVPLLNGMAVIVAVVVLDRSIAWVKSTHASVELAVESKTVLMIESGRVLKGHSHRERVAFDEIHMMLRQKGFTNLAEVKAAYLETSGELSVQCEPEAENLLGLPLYPPPELAFKSVRSAEPGDNLACVECGEVFQGTGQIICPSCGSKRFVFAATPDSKVVAD